jgi:cytochrome c oxidase assembly protein subunit 11
MKLVVIVCGMVGFSYALVPIYRAICDMTGINVLAVQEELNKTDSVKPKNTQIDISRKITVDFDSNEVSKGSNNAAAVWRFKPAQRSITVHPGELVVVQYELTNLQNRTMVGQAIPSYLPARAATHFNKTECFCFKQQTLKPHETKTFPVVFSINPAIGNDVNNITLSYTFFEVKGAL